MDRDNFQCEGVLGLPILDDVINSQVFTNVKQRLLI